MPRSKIKMADASLGNTCAALERKLGPILYRSVTSIRAYDGHARKHPEKQIVQLMASMTQFGFAMPLLVDGAGVLIVGHARYEAAGRLGLAEVPVIVADHWLAAQVKAYRLADNQLATHATWDERLLRIEIQSIIDLDEVSVEVMGWETAEIDVLLGDTGTREILEGERRNLGVQVYSSQFQQNPVAPEGNVIRMEWFGSYEEALERDSYFKIVQSWDTALSDQPTADFSVCTTWGYTAGKWHLLDVYRQRLAFPDLKRAVLRLKRQWQPDEVIIEDAGTGKSLWQEFRASGELRPVMWSVTQSKEERLVGVTAQLEAGVCVLPTEALWLDDLRRELRAFPHGKNDDQVDSLTQFLEYFLRRAPWLLVERDETGRALRINRPSRIQRRSRLG